MKTRLVIIAILLLMLTVLLSRNDEHITDTLLGFINPVKQSYKNFTQSIEEKSHSYVFQKESIEKLSIENRILRKRLLEQMHYIEEVKNIYEILPNLSQLPIQNISIVETISYVKLNSFSQIILTKPKGLEKDKLYGLVQNQVVGGIAKLENNQLFGYLTSDTKCRFSVFTGKEKAPGIAQGVEKNKMIIKFIPKWHKIAIGDKVVTSGLDAIFFADIPVGIVTKVEVQSSYTVAHIKTYSDIFHPKTFFLINDAEVRLSEGFDRNSTHYVRECKQPEVTVGETNATQETNLSQENNTTLYQHDENSSLPMISSIPRRIDQTQEQVIEPEEKNETAEVPPPPVKKKRKPRKHKPDNSTLDLF